MAMRERLRNRQLPNVPVRIRVDFSPESDAAAHELTEATRALRLAEFREQDTTTHQTRLDAAQAAFDAFFEVIVLRALPPGDMEALIAEHPPTAAQRKADSTAPWNKTTFRPALIAACAQGEETEQDWADWLAHGGVADGEVAALFGAAVAVNDRSADLRVGKGSPGSPS